MATFQQQLSQKLSDVHKNMVRLEENTLKRGNLNFTLSEIHLIALLQRHKNGITVSDIAQFLSITRPSATVAVGKLAKKGYLKKENSSHDGRVVRVCLTVMGQRVFEIHNRLQMSALSNVGEELTVEEREILKSALDKLNLSLSKATQENTEDVIDAERVNTNEI